MRKKITEPERAILREKPTKRERAKSYKKTRVLERAIALEKPKKKERVGFGKKTNDRKRATIRKESSQKERAVVYKQSEGHKRNEKRAGKMSITEDRLKAWEEVCTHGPSLSEFTEDVLGPH